MMKALASVGLGISLLMQPVCAAAGAPGEQVRQSVDKLLAIVKDPRLKREDNKNERREKLKEVIHQRFDFTEMAKRSLGSEWRRRNLEEQKEFVKLFTDLLKRSYLEQIESYSGEKIQYLKELEGDNYAEVATKIVDNGDWEAYDVLTEDISLVNFR